MTSARVAGRPQHRSQRGRAAIDVRGLAHGRHVRHHAPTRVGLEAIWSEVGVVAEAAVSAGHQEETETETSRRGGHATHELEDHDNQDDQQNQCGG